MKITVLDFETYYDKEYSLRKMTPVEYILDYRFEAIGCAVKEFKAAPYWVDGPDLPKFFAQLDKNQGIASHNALFDMCVAAWRYGYTPRLIVDTLGMSRACLGHKLTSLSLDSVAQHLGLGVKGKTVHKVEGMSRAAIIAAGLYQEYAGYSMDDASLCEGIVEKLLIGGHFPVNELAVMDMVLRCAIEPSFKLNRDLLAQHLHTVTEQKNTLLGQAMLLGASGKSDLMSNDRFAELLRGLGVEPPMKTSPVTGKVTYAFAKTDVDFLDLQEHDDPAVQALVAARLGNKSTIEETRTQRLINISNLEWPGKGQACLMPVPLKFSGAHTHRMSGDWKLNEQNLPARGGNNTIRRAHEAPEGHRVVAVDSSQIEARLVAWLAGQHDLVQGFANKEDIYSQFASEVFGRPVNRKLPDPEQIAMGFVGKQGVLGLGYGLGWEKFRRRVKSDSKNQLGTAIELSDEESMRVVSTYRRKYDRVPALWKNLNYNAIPVLAGGGTFQVGPCVFEKGSILLPSGLRLWYDNLENRDGEWWFTYGRKKKKIYGGKLLENICQALARVLTFDAALRIQKRTTDELGYLARLKLQAHDENVFIVPNEIVAPTKQIAVEEMCRLPSWATGLPLAAEAGDGPSYGEAK